MKFLCFFLVGLVCATSVNCLPTAGLAQANAQSSLMKYLLQPDINANVDPAVTTQCFNKYLPMLTQIATNFSDQYTECITVANEKTNELTTQAAQNRSSYTKEITGICSAYTTCNNEVQTLDFFTCYSNESSQDVSKIYQLSVEASSAATSLSEGLLAIQQNEKTCTDDAENTYVSSTATTYSDLDSCLANGLTFTEEPSTDEPITEKAGAATAATAAA